MESIEDLVARQSLYTVRDPDDLDELDEYSINSMHFDIERKPYQPPPVYRTVFIAGWIILCGLTLTGLLILLCVIFYG